MVESKTISDVSYYKATTQFADDVLDDGYGGYTNLHITGASLGGGLAIISGAQSGAFTVAISGMGATLSRETFDPPVTVEALNTDTFDWIPERDYIARIGGRAMLYQNAQCRAPKNNLFGCHNMWRSLCELAYQCGTEGRPFECRCVQQHGYPIPETNGNRTFEEACQEAETEWYEMFPAD